MLLSKYVRPEFASRDDFEKNFAINVPEDFNFAYDIVDEWARIAPDKLAMDWCDENGQERTFTFGDMKRWSDKTAAHFTSLGIGRGDFVTLVLKRRYQFWFSIIALHKIGAVVIPATHLLTKKDIVYRCNAADIKAAIVADDAELCEAFDEARKECPTLTVLSKLGGPRPGWDCFDEGVERAPETFARPLPHNSVSDMLMLYFTSGTTGMPKMVAHNHAYPLGHIITASFWHNVDESSLHFTVADTGWGKAVWGKLYGQWIAGAAVFTYDYERFNAPAMLDVIAKHKVTGFCAPPTIYRYLIKENLKRWDLSSLRYATTAGEPLNPEVYHRFLELTGLRIFECFGQTETTVALVTSKYTEPRVGSMGRPSPGFPVGLVDENIREVEAGEQGEIVIYPPKEGKMIPGLFTCYYRDAERDREAWSGGVYHTGDMAWRDEDGYYWYIGRVDDVIKSSGYRIGPFEVESALYEHPAVLECAVTGVPDPDRGAAVKASVMLAKGYTPSDALVKELQEHVKKVTAPYKYPRIVEFVDELPKTINGKIQRVRIRTRDAGQK